MAGQVWAHHQTMSWPLKRIEDPATEQNKIVIRLRNLSPETDGFIRLADNTEAGIWIRDLSFTMKPDYKEWQEVVCHMDGKPGKDDRPD